MRVVALAWVGLVAAQDAPVPGLVGEYHAVGRPIEDFYDLVAVPRPAFKRVDAQVRFEKTSGEFDGTKLRDQFFIRWTGLLRVPRAGRYRFFLSSDDGSRLFIDGRKVVSHGGRHEMTEESGEADLKAGDREIRIEYFDNAGPAGCVLSWEGPGIARQVVPAAAFFHARSAEPSEREKKGIELEVTKKVARTAEEAAARERPIELDESVVRRDEKPPDVVGRVAGVFEDGPVTLVNVHVPGKGERPIYLRSATKVSASKPAPGLVAYVWLEADSKDQAAAARFAREKP